MTSVTIKSFSQSALKRLAESENQSGEPCFFSFYMPTLMAGRETRQNSIRFKNLLGQAFEMMNAKENSNEKLLKPLKSPLDEEDFWQHQSEGLAVFCSPQGIECYQVPIAMPELVMLSNRFYLRPLIPLLLEAQKFFVLALSQGKIRLFSSMTNRGEEIDLGDDIPTSLEEALRFDDPEAQLQFHSSGGKNSFSSGSGNSPVYHGQGVAGTDNKEEIERFFQIIHPKIEEILKDTNAPLVLAGVDFLLPIYREVSNYPHILDSSISGNIEHLNTSEICQQGWEKAQIFFQQQHQQAIEKFQQQQNTDLCTQNLEEVVFAALDGLVDDLLVVSTDNKQIWGSVDRHGRSIEIKQKSEQDSSVEELLNLAVVHTLDKGGNVYLINDEDKLSIEGAAAVLRGPVIVR